MRPGRRGVLGNREQAAELLGLQLGDRRPQRGPHLPFLEVDMSPGRCGERAEQGVELGVPRLHLVEPGQYPLGFLLLGDAALGKHVAVDNVLAHRGPEVHFLRGLMPGLGDDELLGHPRAQDQLGSGCPAGYGGAGGELVQHRPDLLMVAGQDIKHICHLRSSFLVGNSCRELRTAAAGSGP
jgi:hypothetical protein